MNHAHHWSDGAPQSPRVHVRGQAPDEFAISLTDGNLELTLLIARDNVGRKAGTLHLAAGTSPKTESFRNGEVALSLSRLAIAEDDVVPSSSTFRIKKRLRMSSSRPNAPSATSRRARSRTSCSAGRHPRYPLGEVDRAADIAGDCLERGLLSLFRALEGTTNRQ